MVEIRHCHTIMWRLDQSRLLFHIPRRRASISESNSSSNVPLAWRPLCVLYNLSFMEIVFAHIKIFAQVVESAIKPLTLEFSFLLYVSWTNQGVRRSLIL